MVVAVAGVAPLTESAAVPCHIELENVGKCYLPGQWVLQGINLEVAKGEFVGIVGPSGVGKTVLLRLIAGFELLSQGEVRLQGRPVTGPEPSRCMIFQDIRLFPWLSVQENVAFGLTAQGAPHDRKLEVARRWLAMLGLQGFARRYPHQLSGGMQQRAGIARVMATAPEVLLCDEPFGSLDWITREILCDELLRLWGTTRRTVLFVSNAIEEVLYLSQRVYVLAGSPARIIAIHPLEFPEPRWEHKEVRYSREFVGSLEVIRAQVGGAGG